MRGAAARISSVLASFGDRVGMDYDDGSTYLNVGFRDA